MAPALSKLYSASPSSNDGAKTLQTPHKPAMHCETKAYNHEGGGGVLLTPQPRRGTSVQSVGGPSHEKHSEHAGGVSLPAHKPGQSSVANKPIGSSTARVIETSKENPALMTPKGNILSDTGEGSLFVHTLPANFAPRPESRSSITSAPPPAFGLPAHLASNPGLAESGTTTWGSTDTAVASTHSPGSTHNGTASQNVSLSAGRQGNSHADIFESKAFVTPGPLVVSSTPSQSSIYHYNPVGGFDGITHAQRQRQPDLHNDVGLQQLLGQVRQALPTVFLPKLASQPSTNTFGKAPASELLNLITKGFTCRPDFETATAPDFDPFIQSGPMARPSSRPVVKIDDLPYEAKISDIIAFVGGNAKILNDADEPVHIMMERITTKTGAAYVEFFDFEAAVKVVDKHRQARAHGKPIRIHTRIVSVTISSQDQLLSELFPYARGIQWLAGEPYVQPGTDFKGFVTEEELIQMVKNVEFPHRVPYTKACPQRSAETLISIVKKFPWHKTNMITIRQRHRIHKAVLDMIRAIQSAIQNFEFNRLNQDPRRTSEMLNSKLLKRVVAAGLRCPGFSPLMKDDIAFLANVDPSHMIDTYQPLEAHRWRHIYTLAPNPTVPLDVIDYYIAIIREETTRIIETLPPMLRREVRTKGRETDDMWGYFWAIVGFPDGTDFENLTLQQCASLELNAIDEIFRRALPARLLT